MKGVPFDGTYQIFFFCEAVRSFCEQVMLVKERAERERERKTPNGQTSIAPSGATSVKNCCKHTM